MPAEVLLRNARVYTGDAAMPWAGSVSIRAGRIVGLDDEELLTNPAIVDLGARFVMPGFVDVHNHHALAGRAELFRLQLPSSATLAQVLDTVRARAASSRADEWIVGGNWGSDRVRELSDASALREFDLASAGRPVILEDDSRHNCWVNSAAMARASISGATADPPGGVIVRDHISGAPTGLMLESAASLFADRVPDAFELTAEQHMSASEHAIRTLNGFGVTAFQDALTRPEALQALKTLDDSGRLTSWVISSLLSNEPGRAELASSRSLADAKKYRSVHHRPDFVKVYLDGVPPTRTAAFLEPYLPGQGHEQPGFGELVFEVAELVSWFEVTAAAGLSVKLHCAGDAAIRRALDAIEIVRGRGDVETRFHLAHGQFIASEDLARFVELDVVADISPYLWFPGVITNAMRGVLPARAVDHMQPNRDLLDAGALVAGGSDWPVTAVPNPLIGIQGLVTRADPTGRFPGTAWPEQALTVPEAISVFTINGADAMGLGSETGTLEPGKSADLIVLDRNLLDIDPTEIAGAHVDQTWFEGSPIYTRQP